jgi:hypothetical protein
VVRTMIPFIGLIPPKVTASVTVTFANGVVHRRQIIGRLLVRNAKQEVLQFNQQVMAAAASGEPHAGVNHASDHLEGSVACPKCSHESGQGAGVRGAHGEGRAPARAGQGRPVSRGPWSDVFRRPGQTGSLGPSLLRFAAGVRGYLRACSTCGNPPRDLLD